MHSQCLRHFDKQTGEHWHGIHLQQHSLNNEKKMYDMCVPQVGLQHSVGKEEPKQTERERVGTSPSQAKTKFNTGSMQAYLLWCATPQCVVGYGTARNVARSLACHGTIHWFLARGSAQAGFSRGWCCGQARKKRGGGNKYMMSKRDEWCW